MWYSRKGGETVAGDRRGSVQLRLLALRVGHDGPHGGESHVLAARPRPPPHPSVPLADACDPAHAKYCHTRQQKLCNPHEFSCVGHLKQSLRSKSFRDAPATLRTVPVAGERCAHVLRARYHCGLLCASADSVSTMRPSRLIVLNACGRENLVFYTSFYM